MSTRTQLLARSRTLTESSSFRPTIVIGALVTLSRLPLLGHGYGADPDAWRAISAARELLDTGTYYPSRLPGYPLPEYVDTGMLYLGLGSSLWIGLISAVLSGIAASLFFRVLLPLGSVRAVAGSLALAFTPVVYIAGVGNMDYLWGLTFFLAATLSMMHCRVWAAAIFLGLAVASRSTYAFSVIPLVLLYMNADFGQLRRVDAWKRLALPFVCSGLLAILFYVPALVSTKGHLIPTPTAAPPRWLHTVYNSSVGLFGIIGFVAVACAVCFAVFKRRVRVTAPAQMGRRLDGWSVALIAIYGLLFVRLPDEASYLMPALLGLYWLLCHYASTIVVGIMTASLFLSCFLLRVDNSRPTAPRLGIEGPVIWHSLVQDQRRCVAALVEQRVSSSVDGRDYIIAGYLSSQLTLQTSAAVAQHILYTVRYDSAGHVVDKEDTPVPDDARLLILEQAIPEQSAMSSAALDTAEIVETIDRCEVGVR